MSTADLPIPADLMVDVPPLDDRDLDRYFAVVDDIAADLVLGVEEAEAVLDTAGDRDDDVQRIARWQIDDLGAAAWAASRLATADAEIAMLREQADEWARRIGAWFDTSARRHVRVADFMRTRLEDYALRVRAESDQATIPLPAVTLRTTRTQRAVTVTDDAAVAEWARTIPEHVLAERLGTDPLVGSTVKAYVAPLRKLTVIEPILDAEGEDPTEIVGYKVVGLDGNPVPGTAVSPEKVTVSVQVHR